MSVLDMIAQQLDPQTMSQMGRQLGLDPQTTQRAVSTALPVLVGALARNTSNDQGASALVNALQTGGHGNILDDLGGFLGGGNSGGLGGAILGHVLGARQGQAEAAIGKAAGIDLGQAGQLLAMLAPIVMAVLGRRGSQNGFDVGDLVGMLQGDDQRVKQAHPGGGSMLESILDRDGDGQVADDLANLGMNVLGGLLGGGRR